jgi:hypothetical protein
LLVVFLYFKGSCALFALFVFSLLVCAGCSGCSLCSDPFDPFVPFVPFDLTPLPLFSALHHQVAIVDRSTRPSQSLREKHGTINHAREFRCHQRIRFEFFENVGKRGPVREMDHFGKHWGNLRRHTGTDFVAAHFPARESNDDADRGQQRPLQRHVSFLFDHQTQQPPLRTGSLCQSHVVEFCHYVSRVLSDVLVMSK